MNLPTDLPAEPAELGKNVENEAEWEKRATLLAKSNSVSRGSSPVGYHGVSDAPSDVCGSIDQEDANS